jgi:hypothetical protein
LRRRGYLNDSFIAICCLSLLLRVKSWVLVAS